MTCVTRKCESPGCDKPVPPRRPGRGRAASYCSRRCNLASRRAKQRALRQSHTVRPRPGQDEGPDEPLSGWTPAKEMERRERIAAEMLREGWSTGVIQERFAGHMPNIARVRQRFGIPLPTSHEYALPGGLPVR